MSQFELPVLGIDFGTTFSSCAAVVEGGQVQFAKSDSNRSYAEPTVVFKQDNGLVVGAVADNLSMLEPGKSCRHFKRIITEDAPVYLGDAQYQVTDLIAATLAHMRSIAERLIGGMATDAVITHPATYQPFLVDKLKQAAYNAGFDNVDLIPEPVAAAHSFFHDKLLTGKLEEFKVGDKLAVYDLGGGTFDASLYEIQYDGNYQILHEVVGDDRCGGIDFDRSLLRYVREQCGSELDPFFDGQSTTPKILRTRQYINEEIIRIKHSLSVVDKDYFIPSSATDCPDVLLTRPQYENLIRPYADRTIELLNTLLKSAGVQTNQLAGVILIGGSSRTPLVSQLIESELKTRTLKVPDPDLAVCRGAALYGYRKRLTGGVRQRAGARPISLSPADAEAKIKLGVVAYSKKQFSEAKRYFYEVYDNYPNDIRALAGIVSCLLGIGDHVEALSLAITANKFAPRNKDIAALVVRAHIAGRDFDQAKKFGFDYIAGYGSSPELLTLLDNLSDAVPPTEQPTAAPSCVRCDGSGKVPNLFGDGLLNCPECSNKVSVAGDEWRMELTNHPDSIVFLELEYSGTQISGSWFGTAGGGFVDGTFEPRKLIRLNLNSEHRSYKLVGDHLGGFFSGRWRDALDPRTFGDFRLRKEGAGFSPLLSDRISVEPTNDIHTRPANGNNRESPDTDTNQWSGGSRRSDKPPVVGGVSNKPPVITNQGNGSVRKTPPVIANQGRDHRGDLPPVFTNQGSGSISKPPVIGKVSTPARKPPVVAPSQQGDAIASHLSVLANVDAGFARQSMLSPWNGNTDHAETITTFKYDRVRFVVYSSLGVGVATSVMLQIRMNSTRVGIFDTSQRDVCRFTAMAGRMLLNVRLISKDTDDVLLSNTYCIDLGDAEEVCIHAVVAGMGEKCSLSLERGVVLGTKSV